jgi:hypothetical protein
MYKQQKRFFEQPPQKPSTRANYAAIKKEKVRAKVNSRVKVYISVGVFA